MQRFGRRIAFDYGDVRIGVAICDPDGLIASPLATLNSKDPKLQKSIAELIAHYEPVKIYLGEPKLLSGTSADAVEKVNLFAQMLNKYFETPITFIDERLSTVLANRLLQDAGVNSKSAREHIDSMAAVAILNQGLAIDRK